MWKTVWCSVLAIVTTAAAALQAYYAISELVSYETCNPGRRSGPWEYPFEPSWWPAAIAVLLTLAAVALVWSRKRGGLVINTFRFFFLLMSLAYLYFLIDQVPFHDRKPGRFLLVSCGGEDWKDMEELLALGTIFLAPPVLVIAAILAGCAGGISRLVRSRQPH